MKQKLIILIVLMLAVGAHCQQVVTFEELPEKMAVEPRPIVIKIYTDWCSICKMQDRQLSKNEKVKKLFSENYYYLELSAETRKTLPFDGRAYKFMANGTGGINTLAAELCKSQSYPCWVFLSPDYKVISTFNGMLKPNQLIAILSNP
jgi:thioredoxin-related protein